MNFNTFFLDKLSASDQPLSLNSKKGSSSTSLFSDIIKVCEHENTGPKLGDPFTGLNSAPSENHRLTENVVECSGDKLRILSEFIQSFMDGSAKTVSSPEVIHDLQQVVISKKQYVLPAGGMAEFLSGLLQKSDLDKDSDYKSAINSGDGKTDVLQIFHIDSASAENTGISPLDISSQNKMSEDELIHHEMMTQSLLNYLTNSKILNLSFKNGPDKLTVTVREVPEDNIEAKLNFDKLSADFENAGKMIYNSDALPSDKPAEYFLATLNMNSKNLSDPESGAGKNISPVYVSSAGKLSVDNIYKTEVVQVSSKSAPEETNSLFSAPPIEKDRDLSSSATAQNVRTANSISDGYDNKQFKIFNLESDKTLNGYSSTEPLDISGLEIVYPEKLSDSVLLEKISSMPPVNNNGTGNTKHVNASAEIKNPPVENIPIQMRKNSPDFKVSDSNKNLEQNEDNKPAVNTETLKNLLAKNDSINHAVFTKTDSASNSNLKQSGTSIPGDVLNNSEKLPEPDMALRDESVNRPVEELKNLSNQKSTLKKVMDSREENAVNQKNKDVGTEAAKNGTSIDDQMILGGESKNIPVIKPSLATDVSGVENTKIEKETMSNKSGQGINTQENKDSAKSSQTKSSEEKDLSKQKPNEIFKNVLQGSDQANEVTAEKFKNLPEMKQANEPIKILKAPELVHELSKFIQTGEKQSMTFQLSPENLGKVRLIVDLIDNQIHTRIEVENENVKQFVQSNAEQLKQNLQSAGINLGQLNISLAESEQKFAKAGAPRKKTGEKISKIKDSDVNTRPAQKTLGYNTYEYLA
ncbi:MAG: hypothetical protein CVV24_02285 [Ignavibacteriae bacterium HGW-Ignavibacteriae-3]|nr:MAG: hypothetical protein CVV24_02285 [Ignavibacteriae bacterium HGW-Ignavibacteriae-3]